MKKTFILLLAIWLCGVCGVRAAQLNKVAAVVNGQVITMFDLQKTALPELGRARLNPNNPAQAKEVDKVFRSAGHDDHGHPAGAGSQASQDQRFLRGTTRSLR